jgi:superoxide dismutase, Fe-Mn family
VNLSITLPNLPYDFDALEPYLSSLTLIYHYNKHHAQYVSRVNEIINGTSYDKLTIEEIILRLGHKIRTPKEEILYNNVGQAYNHNVYWSSLSSVHGQKPSAHLCDLLADNFSSLSQFKIQFGIKAKNLFGSGWVWLVQNKNFSLEILTTLDGETPLLYGKVPIFNCDIWEHAYYLDYKNDRSTYLENFWNLINWHEVEKNLLKTKKSTNTEVLYGYSK